MSDHGPIPLHVVTGFLGSGKTTLLAALVRHPRAGRLAVLVNDVTDLPLDPWLLERVDEDVWALASGCLCCTLRGELYASLERITALGPDRIVLETSGLTDPAPLLHALATDPRLRARVRAAGTVAVVDAVRAEDLLATQPELQRQLDTADRLLLTKTDLAAGRVETVRELLEAAAPGCELREARHGDVEPDWIFAEPAFARLVDAANARTWLHHQTDSVEGAAACRSHLVELREPADVELLALWLRLVTQVDGPQLLRVKILAEDRSSGDVFALQTAGRLVSPARRLANRPAGVRGLRAVLVERGLGPHALERLQASLCSAARATRVEAEGPRA